jgi:hypothetical protein
MNYQRNMILYSLYKDSIASAYIGAVGKVKVLIFE